MNVDMLVVVISCIMLGLGALYFIFKARRKKDKGLIKSKVNAYLNLKLSRESNENILKGTHFYLNTNTYNLGRYIIALFIMILGGIFSTASLIVLAVFFLIASWPTETFFKKVKSPFSHFRAIFYGLDKEKKDRELIAALSLLKNMMVQMQNNPVGADYIIEYLASSAVLTKTAYLKLLNQLRLNKLSEAEETFGNELETKLAMDMAKILVQLDKLNPIQLKETLISLQKNIIETNITRQKLKDEKYSDIATIPTVATIMMIFINFIIVAYIIDLKNLFLVF